MLHRQSSDDHKISVKIIKYIKVLIIEVGVCIKLKHKRPMDNITNLRKQFKSIITYDYIIMLIKRKKTLLTL